jgi:sterigmatocystin 8-O-methyltransferase
MPVLPHSFLAHDNHVNGRMTQTTSQIELLGSHISSQIKSYMEKLHVGEKPTEEMATISSACRELDALVTPPEMWTNLVAMGYNGSIAICLLFDLNIFQLLSESDKPTPLDNLVKRSEASKSLLSTPATVSTMTRAD